MPDETGPSLGFQLAMALCIVYWALLAWWAFLIVGPERYSLAQWAGIVFLPPLAVMVRVALKSWWARFWYGPWN
jgi:hypothetical protein